MMDAVILTLQIFTSIGIFIAGLFLRKYLPTYLSKKGENLATKEDIAEITQRIESVKNSYASQLERFRSALSVSANQRTAFTEQQRRTLFQFFDHCVELIADKLRVNPGDFPMNDIGQSLTKHQQTVSDLFTMIIVDYYRILLYFDANSDLVATATKIIQSSSSVNQAFKKHFGKVKMALIEETNPSLGGEKAAYHQAVDRTNEAARTYHEAVDPHIRTMEEEFRNYMQFLNVYLRQQGTGLVVDPREVFRDDVS